MRSLRRFAAALAGALVLGTAWGHETLPASLMLDEGPAGVFDVRWRVPASTEVELALQPRLPADCEVLVVPTQERVGASRSSHWRVRCDRGLRDGERIGFDGLSALMLDVLVRVAYLDGHETTLIARPRAPQVTLPRNEAAPTLDVPAYFTLGVQHILSGIDHLLFVLELVLLVRRPIALLKTVTAFTAAHSLTLAASTLGWVHVAGAPVEACIALSIVFLARELVRPPDTTGLATRLPWVVAFVFGLLHGLGFAGALADVGLPEAHIPLALLLFNLGVEAGQLLFVGAVLFAGAALHRLRPASGALVARGVAYGLGGVSAFWLVQRMALVLGLASV